MFSFCFFLHFESRQPSTKERAQKFFSLPFSLVMLYVVWVCIWGQSKRASGWDSCLFSGPQTFFQTLFKERIDSTGMRKKRKASLFLEWRRESKWKFAARQCSDGFFSVQTVFEKTHLPKKRLCEQPAVPFPIFFLPASRRQQNDNNGYFILFY